MNWSKTGENSTHDKYTLRVVQPTGIKPLVITSYFEYTVCIEATNGEQTLAFNIGVNVNVFLRVVANVNIIEATYLIF